MADENEVVKAYRALQVIRRQLVDDLRSLKYSMMNFGESVNTAKTFGTSAGVVGTVAAVGGVVLAYFTAGTSLFLTATAIGGGAVGGATNITTSIVECNKYKNYIKRLKRLVKRWAEEEENVRMIVHNYCQDVSQVAENCGSNLESLSHKDMNIGIKGAKVTSFFFETMKGIEVMRKAKTVSTLLKYGCITGVPGSSLRFQAASIEAYAALLANEVNVMKSVMEYGTSLSGTAKVSGKLLMGTVFSVVQVGLTAFEVFDLVKNWDTQHPAVGHVEDIISKIQAEIKKMDEIIKALDD